MAERGEVSVVLERVARDARGRLLAFLAKRTRDLAAAEDALSDAFREALERWPDKGVPDSPEAWLLTVARRRLLDGSRRARVASDAADALVIAAEEAERRLDAGVAFPDERLGLMLVCAHPAIDEAVRAPLMLQTVLGLDAERIASAFLVKPLTMGQRLARAKAKIRDARIPYEPPSLEDLPARLGAICDAVYVAYGRGWDDVAGADARRRGLTDEAIHLGRVLAHLAPEEPEALGLLALMLLCEARRSARRTDDGAFVPLDAQDVRRWDRAAIAEAERHLTRAAACGRMGRYQIEAAIQSLHTRRGLTGHADDEGVALLYEGLVRIEPSVGALVGRAAAVAKVRGAETGLALLAEIDAGAVSAFQPYWALSGDLLAQLDRSEEATRAYARAMALCSDEATRTFLAERAARLRERGEG